MSPEPTRLFLVRHGETEWNTARIFQGHLDSELTERGREQAALLAARLATEGLLAVYSSDQGRAMRTAEVVGARLDLPVSPRPDLREIDCGDWTGKSYQEVRGLWPDHYMAWSERPHEHCMPGGESVQAVQERGLRFLAEMHRLHPGGSALAVTHHTIVRAVLCHLLGLPLASLWQGPRQPNCALNLIEIRDGELGLIEVANTAHLGDVGSAGHTSVV